MRVGGRRPQYNVSTWARGESRALVPLLCTATSESVSRKGPALPALIMEHRESLTVEDVTEAVGLSVRRLQEGFQRYPATTPTALLLDVRLSGARQ